jgi:hypothetical protein
MRSRLRVLLPVLVAVALAAPAAQADVAFKTGPEINTAQGNCFPLRAFASYSQQKNGGVATEPRVDDVFFITVYYKFFQTFDCAADFVSAEFTLPPGVTPVATSRPICTRWGGQSPNFLVSDPRAGNACPATVAFDAGTRKFRIGPKPGSPSPDFPGTGYWFIGQRAADENVIYHSLELQVPVRSTATMTNQPIGLLVCSVGTSCATGGVNLTVGAAPAPADPPRITFAGQAQTSAVGARIPFSINSPDTNPEFGLKLDIATTANFANGTRPCGQTGPQILPEDETQSYVGDHDNVEFLYGDLDTIAGASACALRPSTTYHLKACTIYFPGAGAYTEQHCQTTSFTTGAVATRFTPPQQNTVDLAANTNVLLRQHQIVGGRPAGNASIRYRFAGSGATFAVGPNQTYAASFSSSTPVDRVVTGLMPWRSYEFVACYQAPATTGQVTCGDPRVVTTGFATSPSDAADIGQTSATLNGQASAPSPAGTMHFLLGTAHPGAGDPLTLLTEQGSAAMAARTSAGAPVTATVTRLDPGTTYYWVACFNNPSGPGIEDCSPVRSFTTAAATPPPAGGGDPTPPGGGDPTPPGGGDPTPPPTGGGSQTPPVGGGQTPPVAGGETPPAEGGGGSIAGNADVLKPTASIKVAGKLKRGKRVTLSVTASDPSGIRSVLIKVGAGKAQAKRKVTIRLPRRKGNVTVVVTVADGAGNVTRLTKTLRVR